MDLVNLQMKLYELGVVLDRKLGFVCIVWTRMNRLHEQI